MLPPSLCKKVLVALTTLTVGILSANVVEYWNLPIIPTVSEEQPLRINACELGDASGKLVGKRISVDVTAWHVFWSNEKSHEDFIVVEPMGPPSGYDYDPFVDTDLDLHGYFGQNANLESDLGAFKREVDLRIVGTLERTKSNDPSSLRVYRIVPDEIELISPFRRFTPKGAA